MMRAMSGSGSNLTIKKHPGKANFDSARNCVCRLTKEELNIDPSRKLNQLPSH